MPILYVQLKSNEHLSSLRWRMTESVKHWAASLSQHNTIKIQKYKTAQSQN